MKQFVNRIVLFAITAITMLFAGAPSGSLAATSIDVDALNDAYGEFYADGSKNLKDLYAQVFHTSEFDELFDVETTNLTVYRKAIGRTSTFTQPFQLPWTPNGTFTVDPSEIPLQMVKVDLELSSYEVYNTWIGFTHTEGKPQSAQDFVQWILNNLVLPGHQEDMEIHGAFAGVYATPTPNTPGAVGTMINGVRVIMNNAITAGSISPIVVGAVPTDKDDMVEYVESFVKLIDAKDRKRPMTLAMSLDNEILFKEGMTSVYNMNYSQAEVTRVKHFENITIKGYAAIGDSDKIWCTPKGNAKKPVNPGNGPLFQFEQEDRRLKVFSDHLLGYGWIDHERVYTNDVDLGDES